MTKAERTIRNTLKPIPLNTSTIFNGNRLLDRALEMQERGLVLVNWRLNAPRLFTDHASFSITKIKELPNE